VSEQFRTWQGGLGDAALLAALHAPAFSDAWPEPAFASLLARDEVMVLLGAFADGAPQGFILLRTVADEAEVLAFCVTKGARRRGLGRALRCGLWCCGARRCRCVRFLSRCEERRGAGLYREAGLRRSGGARPTIIMEPTLRTHL
jgi:ribosomal-protein-alanine N-acetyltransferase